MVYYTSKVYLKGVVDIVAGMVDVESFIHITPLHILLHSKILFYTIKLKNKIKLSPFSALAKKVYKLKVGHHFIQFMYTPLVRYIIDTMLQYKTRDKRQETEDKKL